MKILGSLLCLLACGVTANANNCRVRVVHNQAVVVQEVQLATIVAVPAYQVVYQPNGADVQALIAEIRALRAEVQAIKAAPVTSPDKKELAPSPLKHLEIFQAKCAGCHEAAISKAKGGGFTMLQGGKLALLTDRQLRKISSRSYAGSMPPKGSPQLSDSEVGEVMRWIDSLE